MPNLRINMAPLSAFIWSGLLSAVLEVQSLQLASKSHHTQLPQRMQDYRQHVDGQRLQLPLPMSLPLRENHSNLQDERAPQFPPMPGLPGLGGLLGGGGINVSNYKNHSGLANLYTDPGNDMDLLVDITDLLNGSGLIMITALAAKGTYLDSLGTVLPLHAPMEETQTTIFQLVLANDNRSIHILQPQLTMRSSDSETKLAFDKGVDSPWIGKMDRMMDTTAGEDRIIVDGIKLIQAGFFVSPRMGSAIQTYRLTRVKSYPGNFDVSLTFLAEIGQIAVTFSVMRPPEKPMISRVFDDRLPYFTQDYKDLGVHTEKFKSDDDIDPRKVVDPEVSVIWKYNLDRLPNKQILVYVDPSVPDRWHKAFKKGIEAWNDAFKMAGHAETTIRGVLPRDSDWPKDYDAGDARFNTISWAIDSSKVFSMGIAKVDPRSGEILKSDIVMGAGWVRSWLNDLHAMKLTATQKTSVGLFQESLQHSIEGSGRMRTSSDDNGKLFDDISPDKSLLLQVDADNNLKVDADSNKADADSEETKGSKSGSRSDSVKKTDAESEHAALNLLGNFPMSLVAMDLPKESWYDVVEAGLTAVVMHETGHILGLRHNFKGSLGVSYECAQNMTCSAEQGLTASIMDYIPMNIPSAGVDKVHLFSPVVGAYDKLAIQYGYTNLAPSLEMDNGVPATPDMLKEILEKANKFENCVDGDHLFGSDPLCVAYDLTSEPLRYYEDQVSLLQKLQLKLFDTSVAPGEPYWQYGDIVWTMMAKLFSIQGALSDWVGGMNVSYVHRPDSRFSGPSDSERSVQTISAANQRKAMRLLLDIVRPGKRGLLPPADLLKHLPFRSNDDSISTFNLKANIRHQQHSIMGILLNSSTLKHLELSRDFGGMGVDIFLDDMVYQILGTYEGKHLEQAAPEEWDLQLFLVQGLVQQRRQDDELPEHIESRLLVAIQSALRAVKGSLKRIGQAGDPVDWTKCNSPESNVCKCDGRVRYWSGEDWLSSIDSESFVECTAETFGLKSDVPDPVCECLRAPSDKDPMRTHLLDLSNKLQKVVKKHGLSQDLLEKDSPEKSAGSKQASKWSSYLAPALAVAFLVWSYV